MKKIVLALVLGAVALSAPPVAFASQKVAPQACDPDYWKSMKERAWLEAEREIMQNQNLIFKPDSVLEYVCFDKFISHAGKTLGDIFVHTKYFGDEIIKRGQAESQNNALKTAVYDAMRNYVIQNYTPSFLAGRSTKMKKPPNPNDHDVQMKPPTNSGPLYDQCKIMAEVWKASKCINFAEENFPNDDFHPFVDIKAQGGGSNVPGYTAYEDIRLFSTPCNNMTKQEWQEPYDNAINKDDQMYKFSKPTKKAFEDVRKMVEPGQCKKENAILTGVKIVLSGTDNKEEKDGFCTNPGCTYSNESCQ